MIDHADKNKDGKLTKDELPEPLWDRLVKADADHDSAISKAELEAHVQARLKALPHAQPGIRRPHFGFPGAHPGVGGPLSADRLLEHADKNKDGSLSKAELEEHFKSIHDRMRGRAGKHTEKPETKKPAETKAEEKKGDVKAVEEKKTEEPKSEAKPTEEKKADEKKVEEKKSEEPKSEAKPAEEKKAEEKKPEEQKADDKKQDKKDEGVST